MNTLEQQTERFNSLPTDFQKVLSVFDYDHRLGLIHKKYKLHIDQSVVLENIMADIIFGTERSVRLTTDIEEKLRLTREKAVEIALDINETILKPIRVLIQQNQDTEL